MIKIDPDRMMGKPMYTGQKLSLDTIKNEILSLARVNGVPVTITNDEVKIGRGLASIGFPAEPCIVIYNSEHKHDYHNYIISIKMQGANAYLTLYLGGNSKNYVDQRLAQSATTSIIGSIIGNRAKNKKIGEDIYYSEIKEIINMVLDDIKNNFDYYIDKPVPKPKPNTAPKTTSYSAPKYSYSAQRTTSNNTQRTTYTNNHSSTTAKSQPTVSMPKAYQTPGASYHIKFDKKQKPTKPQEKNKSAFVGGLGSHSTPCDTSYNINANCIISSAVAEYGGYAKVLMNHIDYGKIENVYIPPKTKEGQIMSLPGKGKLNPNNGQRGIYYMKVRIYDSWKRPQGFNIIQETPVLESDAKNGTVVFVPLPHISTNKTVKVTIIPGTQNKSLVRLRGCGEYNPATGIRGDFYLEIKIIHET